MVLLVIDTQIWLMEKELNCVEKFVNGTKDVIEAARKNGVEVIYVQHDELNDPPKMVHRSTMPLNLD